MLNLAVFDVVFQYLTERCHFLARAKASTMAAIRHTLQNEVFSPAEERLVGVVSVTKVGRKKKACFLCAAGTLQLHAYDHDRHQRYVITLLMYLCFIQLILHSK